MTRLEVIETTVSHKHPIIHPDFSNILYENYRQVKNIFLDIKGTYGIDYMGISVINPEKKLIALSTMPNIEFNLINQNLYKYDICFTNLNKRINQIIWWDENLDNLYGEKINQIKLKNNQFNVGMSINRKVEDFYFLYSFATQSRLSNLKDYYKENISGLINTGDFFFKLIRKIYSSYDLKYKLPELTAFNVADKKLLERFHLKLVINNQKINNANK